MKKIFTLLFAAAMTMAASATDYTGKLCVSLFGMDTDAGEATISIDSNADGKNTLTLKNFSFSGMPIGTITVSGVVADQCGTVTYMGGNQRITIAKGDDASVEEWMGPSLGELPVLLMGKTAKNKLDAIILIDLNASGLGVIKVQFGDHPEEVGQIPNSGFERFHTASYKPIIGSTKTSDEPDAWHSFMSCTGSLKSMVATTTHTYISDDVRPGTTGKSSVKVTSSVVMGQSANGTITTGQLCAGSTNAANSGNNAFLNLDNTDTDGAGDPFYTVMPCFPDSISVWVKFHKGASKTYYATMAATITDGTYYQDPENKTYTNIVAKASNPTIAATDEWQRVVVPFDYASYEGYDAQSKAILVTLSTCATPAGGSTGSDADVLYVDDASLIYNSALSSLSYNGQKISGFAPDNYAYTLEGDGAFDPELIDADCDAQGDVGYIVTATEEENAHTTVFVTNYAGDLQSWSTYTIDYTNRIAAGIDDAKVSTNKTAVGFYDLSGRRVANTSANGVYVVRTADGKAYKMIKK